MFSVYAHDLVVYTDGACYTVVRHSIVPDHKQDAFGASSDEYDKVSHGDAQSMTSPSCEVQQPDHVVDQVDVGEHNQRPGVFLVLRYSSCLCVTWVVWHSSDARFPVLNVGLERQC